MRADWHDFMPTDDQVTELAADMAERARPRWRARLTWSPLELWVGARVKPAGPLAAGPTVYLCVLPTVVLRIRKERPGVWWTMHHEPEIADSQSVCKCGRSTDDVVCVGCDLRSDVCTCPDVESL